MAYVKKISILFFTITLSIVFLLHVIARSEATKQSPNAFRNKIASSAHAVPPRNDVCTFYKWFDPNTSSKRGKLLLKNCSSCHMAYYKEWIDDKHSMSQNNPFFLEVYKQFREDHPDKNGNCALCHNPEAVLTNRDAPMGRLNDINLRTRNAKKTNGISCDFCHKIESVDQDPLKKGLAGLNILRTCKGMRDIRFGPIKDPVQISNREELKYNSLYKTSLVCAKCHDGSNGNVQLYSTFTEWVNSPAAKKGVQCQSCHMKPGRGIPSERLSIVDNPDIKQKLRPYYQVHSHSFLAENPHEFRKQYVDLIITVETPQRGVSTQPNNSLIVKATVKNNNYGHSFPTGSPMRNAILVLEVKDKNGNDLKQIRGPRLPIYAGDLKGKSGKLFAKILAETSGEYGASHSKQGILFRKISGVLGIPAQDWWNIFVASDSRIKANGKDVSVYEFRIPDHGKYRVEVTSTLRWRNTWPGLAKIRGSKLEEDLLIEKVLSFWTR